MKRTMIGFVVGSFLVCSSAVAAENSPQDNTTQDDNGPTWKPVEPAGTSEHDKGQNWTEQEHTEALSKRLTRLMERHGLDPNDPNAVREAHVLSAVSTRNTGRSLIGAGSALSGLSLWGTVGLVIAGSKYKQDFIEYHGYPPSTPSALTDTIIFGFVGQLLPTALLISGIKHRKKGKRQLIKLDLDPKTKRKAVLELVAIQPMVQPTLKGVGFAFAF